jgi:hypothetical protein
MLRCRSIASLRRTVSTPPFVDFSRASPLDLFEQPARGFFQTLLEHMGAISRAVELLQASGMDVRQCWFCE